MSLVDIPASHGRLEGLLWKVESPVAAAVVCHPHPLHGGTMHNHVTYRLAAAFRDARVTTLRFNFRGVGRSTGKHDEGRGEVDDAKTALNYVAELASGLPLIVAGFSFGCRVAMRVAVEEVRVDKFLGAGLAVSLYDLSFGREIKQPKAFIQAEFDEYGELEKVRQLIDTFPPPKELFVVPGADHLCNNHLKEFEAVAQRAVAWLMEQKGPAIGQAFPRSKV